MLPLALLTTEPPKAAIGTARRETYTCTQAYRNETGCRESTT